MISKSQLSNGVRIVTEEISGARSVSIGVIVDASPQDELASQSGLAHLTEHAMFLGTHNRDASDIARMVDEAGGQMGAFTSRDYTCFYANVLDDYCTYAMDLLGDMLMNSTLSPESIEAEKQTIFREISSSNDDPTSLINERLKTGIWREHPLGRSIQGSQASVETLTHVDVVEFTKSLYVPENIIVTAAGAVDHEHFVAQSEDAFWSAIGERRQPCRGECKFHRSLVFESRPLSQAYFTVALRAGRYADQNRYALHVLNCILGGGMSSRLFRQLREESRSVYHIQSGYHAYRDAGLLTIDGVTDPDQLVPVLARVMIELARIAAGDAPVAEEELWKAKMQVIGQTRLAGDNIHTRMSRLANQELYFQRSCPEDEMVAAIEAVDCDNIKLIATQMLEPAIAQASVGLAGPELSDAKIQQVKDLIDDFSSLHCP